MIRNALDELKVKLKSFDREEIIIEYYLLRYKYKIKTNWEFDYKKKIDALRKRNDELEEKGSSEKTGFLTLVLIAVIGVACLLVLGFS